MKIVSTSYSNTLEYRDPLSWLKRINFYTGLLEELAKQHTVLSIERINHEGIYEQNGVCYRFLRHQQKITRFPWRMHRFIKDFRPDVVLVNGFIFPLQILQLRWKLGRKAKIIILHRAEKPFSGLKRYWQKMADSCVDAYLFSSKEFGRHWIEKGIIRDRQKVHEILQASSVFQPRDPLIARASLGIGKGPVFLWVGRLDSNKDPITVLKAFIQFLKFEPTASLFLIYQTEELLEEVKQLIREGKAGNAIQLVGPVSHDQLSTWYSSADFIISGSHYEGSGISVCEAMSCGCIPILSDIISFRSMTGPGKCGRLYQTGQPQELFNVLMETQAWNLEEEKAKTLEQFNSELSFQAIAGKINKLIAAV